MSVPTYVRAYVRPSTKSFFDINEIWHVGRGWWVMHNGMQYDPIRALKSWKSGHFQKLSSPPFTMRAGNWPRILKLGTISKFDWAGFLIFGLTNVDGNVGRVDRPVLLLVFHGNYLYPSCTVNEILSLMSQNSERLHDTEHIHSGVI